MNIARERRKYTRVEANIKTSFQPMPEGGAHVSLIINLSQGGMLLKSSQSFPVDLALKIRIEKGMFADKEIDLAARINRVETIYEDKLYHIAVEFDRSKKDVCKIIDAFYTRVLDWKKKDSEERLKN
jgi:c-di-GMP-binding flagellar brake protein YcgR